MFKNFLLFGISICLLILIQGCSKNDSSTNATRITFTFQSTPSNGVPITISKADINGQSNGNTAFSRQYDQGATGIYMTAPGTFNGKTFKRWVRDGGAYYEYSTTYGVNADSDHTFVAEYENGGGNTVTFSFQSTPSSGVPITISKADINGQSNGNTAFSRQYDQGATGIYMTAPGTFNGKTFHRWVRDGGAYYEYSTTYGVNADSDHTFVAEYENGGGNTVTFSFQSTPSSGVPITISKADINGQSNGNTAFSRQYDQGATGIYMTAPGTFNGKTFKRWVRDGGAYYEYSTTYGVNADSDHTFVAEYQ